jgi:predicted Zn finger-like uncharacterized protein
MPRKITCPNCNAVVSVPDELLGRTVRCPRCKTPFTAEAAPPGPPVLAEEPTDEPGRAADDDRPRGRPPTAGGS